jgi:hypothetical protein
MVEGKLFEPVLRGKSLRPPGYWNPGVFYLAQAVRFDADPNRIRYFYGHLCPLDLDLADSLAVTVIHVHKKPKKHDFCAKIQPNGHP